MTNLFKIRFEHPRLLSGLILLSVIFLLYSVSLGHNFLFDEDNIILHNPIIREPSKIFQILNVSFFQKLSPGSVATWNDYYRPLTLLTFATDYWVWKVNPLGYNLTNTFLHMAICLLFFALLLRIFQHDLAAFLGALLFSVHTIHTEAVTYIASRGDLLSAFFILLAMLFYWRGWIAAVFLIYILAPFAKESGVLLPAYLLILDISFIKTPKRKLIFRFLCFAAVGLAYIAFRKFFSPVPLGPGQLDLREAALRFFSMGPPFLSYLHVLVAPENFRYCDGVAYASGFWDPQVRVTLIVLFCLAIAWGLALRYRGAAFFGLNLFLLSYGPSLQIIHYYPEWAEHYLFVPYMGLVILLTGFFKNIFLSKEKKWALVLWAIYIPFTAFVCRQTVARNLHYNDLEKYYIHLSRSASPYAYYGHMQLAREFCIKGDWAKGAVYLKAALRIEPSSELNHYNLAIYYAHVKDFKKAASLFKKAYKLGSPPQPIYLMSAPAAFNQIGHYQAAIREIKKIYPLVKDQWTVYRDLIRAYEFSGRSEDALEWTAKGVELTTNVPSGQPAMIVEALALAFRLNDHELFKKYSALLFEKYPNIPWYGDLARFFTGEYTTEKYQEIVAQRYRLSQDEANLYILMNHVMRGDRNAAAIFYHENKERMEKAFDDKLLIQKIFERIDKFLIT